MIFRKRGGQATATQDEARRRDEQQRDAARRRDEQERRQQAAVQARAEREREENEREAERYRAESQAFEERVGAVRCIFPGDVVDSLPESRLAGQSWRSRLVERLIGRLR